MFKNLSLLILLVASFQLMAVAGDVVPVAMPADAEKICNEYQKKVNAKMVEINTIKINEIVLLEKAMKSYLQKSGDMEGAKAIQDKITALKTEVDTNNPVSVIVADNILGKWKIVYNNGQQENISIQEGFKVVVNGPSWNNIEFTLKENLGKFRTVRAGIEQIYILKNGKLKVSHGARVEGEGTRI